jgi:uncharacterized NAD-dependent epimerase/dehydratase family protein
MKKRIVILAERKFDSLSSKMANVAIRYFNKQVVAIIDSSRSGKVVQDVLGYGGEIPIYSSLDETLQHDPNTLLIGVLTQGGKIPSDWYPLIIKAIQNRLNIINGLQEFVQNIAEFRVLAEKYNVKIIDLQNYSHPKITASGAARNFQSKIILTVGTHMNVGKMVTTIELVKEMLSSGKSADWLATGQAGIFLKGKGIPVEMINGKYISGTLENAIKKIDGNFEYIFIEGQGSLQYIANSSVALGILHGCLPDAMILCHRTDIGLSEYKMNTADLNAIIKLNEQMITFIKPSKVIGISLFTHQLSDDKAKLIIKEVEKKSGLAVTDPLRFGVQPLQKAIMDYFKNFKKSNVRINLN